MRLSDVDYMELPPRLAVVLGSELIRWEVYQPAETIEGDAPFNRDWWKYVYWIPKMKKEIYLMNLQKNGEQMDQYWESLGMNKEFLHKHYKEFLKRLAWMRKNNKANHLGEL